MSHIPYIQKCTNDWVKKIKIPNKLMNLNNENVFAYRSKTNLQSLQTTLNCLKI